MTKCNNCDVVDLSINKVLKDDEEFQLCPNCGLEGTVEEIDEREWAESMALADADFQNELLEDIE